MQEKDPVFTYVTVEADPVSAEEFDARVQAFREAFGNPSVPSISEETRTVLLRYTLREIDVDD